MLESEKKHVIELSKPFMFQSKPPVKSISILASRYLIFQKLSVYLNQVCFKNSLKELPKNNKRPEILVIEFEDGTKLIPSHSDFTQEGVKDWIWIDPHENTTT